MKQIRKSSWQYRFIWFILDYEPKTTCGFNFHLALAFIISPIMLYCMAFCWSVGLVDTSEELNKKPYNKNTEQMWFGLFCVFFITAVAWIINWAF